MTTTNQTNQTTMTIQFDAAEAERAACVASKRSKAEQTGKPVVLERWTTDRCMNGHSHGCSFDIATRFILPDGTTETTYTCCY